MSQSMQHNKIHIGSRHIAVRTISTVLFASVVCVALLYVYLLASTTMNVTMRKTMLAQSREVQSHIADLEAEYMVQRAQLTLAKAEEYGFAEPNKQTFVYRYKTSESLALGLE